MTPRQKTVAQGCALVGLMIGLVLLFPSALEFVELAARELRYFWWLILLVVLGGWLLWGFRRRG